MAFRPRFRPQFERVSRRVRHAYERAVEDAAALTARASAAAPGAGDASAAGLPGFPDLPDLPGFPAAPTTPTAGPALDAAPAPAGSSATTGPPARPRHIAIGDPQAPLEKLLEILDRHDLLGADGQLHDEVHLVSVGDHFDWGDPGTRERAAESATLSLSWLAAHAPDRVTLMAGNHDLARVGELARFDDETFLAAWNEARAIRAMTLGSAAREKRAHAFWREHPEFATVRACARDLSCFASVQRDLVAWLLRGGRWRMGYAPAPDLLVIHAALTPQDLEAAGVTPPEEASVDAPTLAAILNARLDAAVAAWPGPPAPFEVPPLYVHGSRARGEPRGVLAQRPADPELGESHLFEGPPRRRFDPRTLAPAFGGLVQVTGHIRDHKCRDLMPQWSDARHAHDGLLRHLWTDGTTVRYGHGLPDAVAAEGLAARTVAAMVLVDGGMNHADPAEYELFDLVTRTTLPRH